MLTTSWIEISELVLKREKFLYTGFIGFSSQPYSLLCIEKEQFLQPQEIAVYKNTLSDRKKRSFLRGRYIAKKVVSAYVQEEKLINIGIKSGVFNQPLVVYEGQSSPDISIAHTDEYAACLAFPDEHPMGIDLEKIWPAATETICSQMTTHEQQLNGGEAENTFFTRLWSIKEALSKVLKTGLLVPLEILEIASLCYFDGYTVCSFTNFAQYKAISFYRDGHICSIVLPGQTSCQVTSLVKML